MSLNSSLKILFVDDEILVREAFSAIIVQRLGIEPQLANDGQHALEMIKNETPDILITDTNMPIIHGVDLIREVKKNYPQILIFSLFSGLEGSPITAEEIKELGASMVLDKVEIQTLLMPVLESLAKKTDP